MKNLPEDHNIRCGESVIKGDKNGRMCLAISLRISIIRLEWAKGIGKLAAAQQVKLESESTPWLRDH